MKRLAALAALFLMLHLSACGMLLYPERRGQTSGRVDPVVAVLDGIGLLVFIIPGIVAFGVDIGTGTIYLPSGKHSGLEPGRVRTLAGNGPLKTLPEIEAAVSRAAGRSVDLEGAGVWAWRCDDREKLTQSLTLLGG
jgi:hypothetical protein